VLSSGRGSSSNIRISSSCCLDGGLLHLAPHLLLLLLVLLLLLLLLLGHRPTQQQGLLGTGLHVAWKRQRPPSVRNSSGSSSTGGLCGRVSAAEVARQQQMAGLQTIGVCPAVVPCFFDRNLVS
jgi:hypothetical protein